MTELAISYSHQLVEKGLSSGLSKPFAATTLNMNGLPIKRKPWNKLRLNGSKLITFYINTEPAIPK
jgi:hypothetical protein